MNVNDIDKELEDVQNKLAEIFSKQRALMEKYEAIEEENGLLQTHDIPVNIDDRHGQARIKDFLWRTTEEICEALDALHEKDRTHFKEEIADALHFFVEMCILLDEDDITIFDAPFGMQTMIDKLDAIFLTTSGYTDSGISFRQVKSKAVDFIQALGMIGNTLKNKPWKQSHMKTDLVRLHGYVQDAFVAFIHLAKASGFTSVTLYDMYFKKNEVNKFRQRSNY